MKPTQNRSEPKSCGCTRRSFLIGAAGVALTPLLLDGILSDTVLAAEKRLRPMGPASKYTPTVRVAFVRRRGEYGMRWPGAIYDGEAAFRTYRRQIEETAAQLGMRADIRPAPIYSLEEADRWLDQAQAARPDGLMIALLDRQDHSWPTAAKGIDSGTPTVVFAPVGTTFTSQTGAHAKKQGGYICSTDDFSQAAFGMKMIKANVKLREMRLLVIRGDQRRETEIKHLGSKLRYLPARSFLEEYERTPMSEEIKRIGDQYIKQARKLLGPTKEDVYNGVKSYVVARTILEREEGDGITMDCLNAMLASASLPCIAFSRMLDEGVPAGCEADIGPAITHALVLYLFDRPGFQANPVPETAQQALIASHCLCPTRLNGIDKSPEPFTLNRHHGNRDAVPRTLWREGQRVTVARVVHSNEDETPTGMIISTGTVLKNLSAPPSGGCVVSVMVKLDGDSDPLTYPSHHHLYFYGDYRRELLAYCQLFGITPMVV